MNFDEMIRVLVPSLRDVKGQILAYRVVRTPDGRRLEFVEVRPR